jgi:hypothetical protein
LLQKHFFNGAPDNFANSSSRLFSPLGAVALGGRFGVRLGHLHVPTSKMGAMPTAGKVLRKNIDELFDQVDGGSKTRVRYRVVMHLAVISYTQVSNDWYAINLNVVRCVNHNMMTFVGCFPDGCGSLVLVTLDFLYPEGIFSHVGGDRLGGRPRDGLPGAHTFSPVRWNCFSSLPLKVIVIEPAKATGCFAASSRDYASSALLSLA